MNETLPRTALGSAWEEYKDALRASDVANEAADKLREESIAQDKLASIASARVHEARRKLDALARKEAGVS